MPVVPPAARPLKSARGGPRVGSAAAILAVLIVALGLVLLFMQLPRIALAPSPTASPPPGSSATPSVIGKDVNEAARILVAAGFRDKQGAQLIDWEEDRSASGTPCSVVKHEPKEGTPYQLGAYAKLFLVPGGSRDRCAK